MQNFCDDGVKIEILDRETLNTLVRGELSEYAVDMPEYSIGNFYFHPHDIESVQISRNKIYQFQIDCNNLVQKMTSQVCEHADKTLTNKESNREPVDTNYEERQFWLSQDVEDNNS